MNRNHVRPPGWRLGVASLCLATVAIGGCGLSTTPCDTPECLGFEEELPSRNTPSELLRDYFPRAYGSKDSILYVEMLDERFTFEFLQADADSLRSVLGENNFWGKTLDLQSTGRLFRREDITDITLDIRDNTNAAYLGDDCDGCRVLDTTVTLRVGTTIDDGSGTPLIFAVDSPQTFVCKPDPRPEHPGQWILFRQVDRPRT